MIATPALCRLCRQPLPRGAVKCPACRARVAWPRQARASSAGGAGRGWRMAACVLVLALVVAGALAWRAISRDLRAPVPAAGEPAGGRPSAADCAALIAELLKSPSAEPSIPPEVRDRLRQCRDRRS